MKMAKLKKLPQLVSLDELIDYPVRHQDKKVRVNNLIIADMTEHISIFRKETYFLAYQSQRDAAEDHILLYMGNSNSEKKSRILNRGDMISVQGKFHRNKNLKFYQSTGTGAYEKPSYPCLVVTDLWKQENEQA
jgi:hypothetical protein